MRDFCCRNAWKHLQTDSKGSYPYNTILLVCLLTYLLLKQTIKTMKSQQSKFYEPRNFFFYAIGCIFRDIIVYKSLNVLKIPFDSKKNPDFLYVTLSPSLISFIKWFYYKKNYLPTIFYNLLDVTDTPDIISITKHFRRPGP